jgi:hypothetical protein
MITCPAVCDVNLYRQLCLSQLRERLQQIGKMSGLGDLGLDDEDDEFANEGDGEGEAEEAVASKKKSRKGGKRARNNKLKLSEDFLDEDWDPEKHEVRHEYSLRRAVLSECWYVT